MDTKQLVDKFTNGEITEDQFNDEASKLSPEEKLELNKHAEEKLPDAVKKLINVRRGTEKVAVKAVAEEDASLATKLREENYVAARDKFFTDMGIDKDEDRKSFEEGFKKFDEGSVNVENIVKDMRKFYAANHADDFFSLREEKKRKEQEAEEFNAQNGGVHGSGGGEDPTKKVPKEVRELMQASAKAGRPMTAERAERAIAIMKNKGRLPNA